LCARLSQERIRWRSGAGWWQMQRSAGAPPHQPET